MPFLFSNLCLDDTTSRIFVLSFSSSFKAVMSMLKWRVCSALWWKNFKLHFCFDGYSIKMQQLNLHQLRKWIICFLSLLNLVLVFCWIGSLVPFQSRTWVVQPPPDVQWQCRLHGQIQVWSWAARSSWKQCPWRNHKPRERKFDIPVWLMRVDKEAVGEVPWTWCGSFQNIKSLLIDNTQVVDIS